MSNDEVFPEGFEELSDLQDATGKEILDLVRNYGKDGQTRKTKDKLLQKKERLENLWDYFDTNDTQIRDKYSDKPHHEYFTKDFYEKIKGAYENMKADIISRLSSLPVLDANQTMEKPPAATPSGSSVKPAAAATEADKMKMTRTLTTRDRYKMLSRHFQSSLDNCSTELKNTYPHMFEIKVKNLVDNFEQLKLVFQRVDGDLEEEDVNIYFHLQKQLEIRLTGLPTKGTTSDHQMAIASLKLPKIELPKFDGCYLKWRQFYDLFKPMILEQPISPAQKLYFLRTNLTGEALSLIQGFPATDSNFEAAWKTLMDRYDNKRLLLCAQLEKLLSQQSASGTASSLRKLHDNTKEGIQALINLGFAAYDWDPIVVHLILKKVDKESRTLFEQSLDDPRSSPSLLELLKFIESRFQTLETITHSDEKRKTTAIAIESNGCVMCSLGNHKIYKCKKFLSLSGADREKSVQRIGICRICLRSGHTHNSCNARGCFLCNGKHNTLLHYKKENKYNLKANPISNANTISSIGDRNQQIKQGQGVEGQSSNAASNSRSNHRSIYLATALVNVRSACGTLLPCRALLDSGSQIHFVTAAFAHALGIQKHRSETSISGIGGHGTPTQFAIELSFQSRNGSFKGNIEATILAKITDYRPHDSHTELRDLPAHIQLADPGFMTNQKIDLLIGAELFFDLLLPGEIFIGPQLPLLRNTKLGWIVAGGAQGTKHNAVCSIATATSLSKIEKLVSRFWECESHDSPIKRMSNEERNCEDFFNSTTQILPSGRFMVSLPFKKDPSSLGASFEKARKRLISLERRLELNNELRLQYTQFLLEYEQLGHMSQIENSDIPQTHYFIPHHCVLKPESSSTALRVVFDCSAKTSSGNSLNDVLGIGPTVQPDLFSIILRFRLKRYAFTADISKMYRQVLLRPEDRAFQIILWRTKNDQPLRTYRLNTLTYGSASAPYLATKCLVQLAKQYENVHVNASQTVSQNIYVDDLLAGADSVSKARELLEEIILLLEKGKFELRKFCSNDENILKNIPDAHKEKLVRFHQSDVIKTLGLIWNPTIDCFEFGFNSEKFKTPEATVTRRSVLSDLARLFDPLGLLSPAIMLGRLFVQDLWKTNFSWDNELPLDLASKWKDYINQFFDLRSIRIPRFANIKTQGGVLQRAIHNLCPLPVEEAKKYPETVKTDHPIEKEEIPLLTVEADSTKPAISRKSQGGKITKGLVLISCLFAFFVAPISSTNIDSQVVISNLDKAIGIYFEDMGTLRVADNFWSLYVYYNLTNYWLELSETKGYLRELEKACMADKSERIYHCNSTIDILRKRIINIDQKNDLINGFNTTTQSSMRHRRSPIDFVGSVAHSLFGVLDQEDAQHIQNQIELANKQDQHLYSLIRKQSSIADSTANILRRNSLEVQNDFNTLNTYLTKTFNTIGKQQNEIVNNQHFLALTTYLSMMLNNYERTQDVLLDVILDLNHAKINPQIITPMQVSSQLQLIQGNLPSSLRLPSVSALEMLKLITVKGRTLHETIVFEVLIPLAEDQEFQVFNLIPLPIVHNNMSLLVDVTSPYLAVTLARDKYFGLSYIEFNSCKLIGTRNHLCRQIVPTRVHSKDFKVCEMALLNHEDNALEICDLKEVPPQDHWYALRQTDSWIFSVMNNVTGLLICNGQTRSISLSGTGMIGFNNICSLKIDTMIINGHLNLKTIITKSFVPSARLSNWIRNRNLTDDHFSPLTVRNNNETDVKNLSQEIEDLKRAMTSDELPPANIHDFHHYGLSYLLLAITIGMIVIFCRYRKHQAALQIPIRRRGSRFQATI